MTEQEFEDLWENAQPIKEQPGWWINEETGHKFLITTSTYRPEPKIAYPIVHKTYTLEPND